MKAIIGGLRYDTETAEEVFSWTNGRNRTDLRFRAKTLYRTRNGRYFLHHDGGPMTDMGRRIDDHTITGSESIEPISEDAAFRFLCSHGGIRAAERLFPDRIQDA